MLINKKNFFLICNLLVSFVEQQKYSETNKLIPKKMENKFKDNFAYSFAVLKLGFFRVISSTKMFNQQTSKFLYLLSDKPDLYYMVYFWVTNKNGKLY